jgi:hypothetical protein
MSNRKKLPKKRETVDYTIDNFIEDESNKWAEYVQSVGRAAQEGGEHGVMVIGTEKAFVCEHVPFGRVFSARDQEAYDKFAASKGE